MRKVRLCAFDGSVGPHEISMGNRRSRFPVVRYRLKCLKRVRAGHKHNLLELGSKEPLDRR